VQSTIHWVSAAHAVDAEVRLYDRLFTVENPGAEESYLEKLNPASLVTIPNAKLEQALAGKPSGWFCQLERLGYFCVDPDSTPERPVLNRTITLKDTWAKIEARG
jgi:glutaminyl-tRNA synthetase